MTCDINVTTSISGNVLNTSISGNVITVNQATPSLGAPEVILGTITLVSGLNLNFPDRPVSSGVSIAIVTAPPGGIYFGGSGTNEPFRAGSDVKTWSYPGGIFPVTNLNQMTAYSSEGGGKISYSAIYISG